MLASGHRPHAGPSCVTDLATVAHQVHVRGVDVFRTGQIREHGVGALGRHSLVDQSEAAGDAMHVRIDRHDGTAEGEHEHAGGGLRADARQAAQVCLRLLVAEPVERAEVRLRQDGRRRCQKGLPHRRLLLPEPRTDRAEDGLDARRLGAGEPAELDRLLDRLDGRVAHGAPRREARCQGRERPLRVRVCRVLREDRVDEFVDRGIAG